mmetsp:Transcript_9/g.6  ORF Transcript_9/g.6 Transcript_9/m.6 type:complete len:90 (+) Transcript_9:510-779(+)
MEIWINSCVLNRPGRKGIDLTAIREQGPGSRRSSGKVKEESAYLTPRYARIEEGIDVCIKKSFGNEILKLTDKKINILKSKNRKTISKR